MKERRQHIRFPVAHNVGQVVTLDIKTNKDFRHDEAVIIDLSAGGVAILTAADIPVGAEFKLSFQLPSLHIKSIKCIAVRVEKKTDINKVGIKFIEISPKDRKHLNKIAQDYSDCETKLFLGLTDVCFKKCHYFPLCDKDVKIR